MSPTNLPDPRRNPTALARRNRNFALILVAVAVAFYLGIQLRWGWIR
jgi:hypothetical protein